MKRLVSTYPGAYHCSCLPSRPSFSVILLVWKLFISIRSVNVKIGLITYDIISKSLLISNKILYAREKHISESSCQNKLSPSFFGECSSITSIAQFLGWVNQIVKKRWYHLACNIRQSLWASHLLFSGSLWLSQDRDDEQRADGNILDWSARCSIRIIGIPIDVQEMMMAVRLIVKEFDVTFLMRK